jgi:DNA-binding PadR family transcriptional regulator
MPKSRSLPAVTHLQFLVLGILRSQEQSGRAIREILATYGVKRTAPAFYQLMSRMEAAGLVDGRYEQIVVGDQAVTERRYRIAAEGQRAWEGAHDFYAEVGRLASKLRWSNA